MRVSEKFHLDESQGSLDFVDVDITDDVPLYIDPSAIGVQQGEWAEECQDLLRSFFSELLDAISANNVLRIRQLVTPLIEPNETHLGVSTGASRGRGLGHGKQSERLVQALASSRAAQTGLLRDLEDSALFVEGIGRDIISDIATNIIRSALIAYTQQICDFYGIPMEAQHSGAMWDKDSLSWDEAQVELPRGGDDKLILVPKSIVRFNQFVESGRYYRGYVRPYLVDEEMDRPGSDLIRVLKSGEKRVDIKGLDKKIGITKPKLINETNRYPDALVRFKESISATANPALVHDQIRSKTGSPQVDLQELMESVKAISPGAPGAGSYHRAVAALLTAIFDTSLGNERIETPLYGGLKRIDITYDNIAGFGFFRWLSLHYPAATIVVECKNYSSDLANEQLDQILGRFSPSRGRVGLLLCRSFTDKQRFIDRCKAAASDQQGYVLVLDDSDLEAIIADVIENDSKFEDERHEFPLLRERFAFLVGG